MAKTIKACDYPVEIACRVFSLLNYPNVKVFRIRGNQFLLKTDVEPKKLNYPEGWYYAKGTFRNKHMSSTGIYHEVDMEKNDGSCWRDTAKYCTLDDWLSLLPALYTVRCIVYNAGFFMFFLVFLPICCIIFLVLMCACSSTG